MEYLPIQEFANRWNISKRRIQILCKEGRINGSKMLGNMWVIPENSDRPMDARTKNPVTDSRVEGSSVRKELKRLLKSLYDSCKKNGMEPETWKDYVLSAIAVELCSFYLGTPINDEMQTELYQFIATYRVQTSFYPQDLQLVNDFIQNYKYDDEINDILSWAYQYSNKFIQGNPYCKTQFFTEKYMIKFLTKNVDRICNAEKILDPCVGGGNFLVECLEELCNNVECISVDSIIEYCSRLYGFDIDNKIARIALVNIRLRAFAILKRNKTVFDVTLWSRIMPNIYVNRDYDEIQGSLTKDNRLLVNVINQKELESIKLFKNADVVVTNPPFATVKGMRQEQKDFMKKEYPLSNCDTCVAFVEAIKEMLTDNGICGIVSQSAWMHLKSFELFRAWVMENYKIEKIINLGSGAFLDLNGEKSNVSLLILSNKVSDKEYEIKVYNVLAETYDQKSHFTEDNLAYIVKNRSDINGANGFNFEDNDLLGRLKKNSEMYKSIATPMQGTSTGNAKELVGYFWEHFGDPEWILVSNGGGYCRWQGLNDSVVLWGKDGEYIKAQKGSALRNVKYFHETEMVFSDTGTAGLNVRLLHDNQYFIASGPGIRIHKGNMYAHMAFLNSRIASYFLRLMSPKLTIAAGYIGQIPINDRIYSSVVLEKNARLCIELKEKQLSIRTNNIEYSDEYFDKLPRNLEKAAWYLCNEDITNELLKLELEAKIDEFIMDCFDLSDKEKKLLDENVGKCAYNIRGSEDLDLNKLDKYIDRLIDSSCSLKRTKNSQNAIGSDGYIEYISKELSINPEIIVRKIQDNPYILVKMIKKYGDLIIHNYVLRCFNYNTNSGVLSRRESIDALAGKMRSAFGEFDYERWLVNDFNDIHTAIFKGRPYLVYDKGEIRINDKLVTKDYC